MINVTIWHEYRHEKIHPEVSKVYPQGMHEAIAQGLRQHATLMCAPLRSINPITG